MTIMNDHSVKKIGDWSGHFVSSCESTQDLAKKILKEKGSALPFFVMAEKQTKGRGRRDHHWISEKRWLVCVFCFPFAEAICERLPT